ncbi:unnamed protein product [Nezara viridula]|uniref:Uncharacterized protein n=1 Tax=Nezara viridula TaxID=85310 RepID=A0A9P0H3S6_NEZVI|nr:unnamed protein product [Nezara viridula]
MVDGQKQQFMVKGWENGPSSKRDLKGPGKIKEDPILYRAFYMVYIFFFLVWELAAAFGSFLCRLILRPEPKSLRGRVCLVTGSGRGLGREFCLALAREGAVIACADINEANNKTTAEMVKELGAKVVPYTVNIAVKKDVENLVSRIEKDLGPIFLLINNAAIVVNTYGFQEDFLRATFNTNVFGPTWLMNAVLPTMKLRNEGHIVNIASVATMMVLPPMMVYGATKSAMTYLSNCLRAELLMENHDNIVITTVHPIFMNSSEDYLSYVSAKVTMCIEMEEVVRATMNAIHYNYDEVPVPSYIKYPLLLITEMMPSRTGAKLLQLIINHIIIPNADQFKQLPWYDLVKECSLMETQKEK